MTESLQLMHSKAWGKAWPSKTCTIHCRDDFPDNTNGIDGNEEDEEMSIDNSDNDSDDDHTPMNGTKEFTYLIDVDLLQHAFEISGSTKLSVIVICEEYEFLRELLKDMDRPLIVTGQPGTGRTVFLLYLLLYRLQLELPTAVQFSLDQYIVFHADGVFVYPTDHSIDHLTVLPPGCWCLSDGNEDVAFPCKPFRREGLRTFLITSPSPNRYKIWRAQVAASTVITALPREVEVAAIAKMHGLKPRDAISIMRKWGPCIRTVMTILRNPNNEKYFNRYAINAAIDISNERLKVPSLDDLERGQDSTLLYVHPIRSKDIPDYGDSRLFIPTIYLSEIFDAYNQSRSAQSVMRLYEVFSMHSITRSPAGWMHERGMHLNMMAKNQLYEIFNGGTKSHINSGALVPGGTASKLRAAMYEQYNCHNMRSSFYWLPACVNCPGIDGVLVNDNHIYALQATIADTHRGPRDGLKKIWRTIGADIARHFTWHFVMVTDNKPLADKYADVLGTSLRDVDLGRSHVTVKVSMCVMKSDRQLLAADADGSGVGGLLV